MKRLLPGLLIVLASAAWIAPAFAQKNLGDSYKDPDNGYSLRVPQKWKQIPVPPTAKVTLAHFVGPRVDVNMGKAGEPNTTYYAEPKLLVLEIVPKATGPDSGKTEEDEGEEEDPKKPLSPEELKKRLEELEKKKLPRSFDEWVKKYSGMTGIRYEGEPKKGKTGKYDTTEYRFSKKGMLQTDRVYALVYHLEGRDLAFVYELIDIPAGFPKWADLFEQSAHSVKASEKKAVEATAGKPDAAKPGTPESERKKHLADIERTPGWLLDESKRYFFKIPEGSKGFLSDVKDFAEALRNKLEEDFPLAKPIAKRGALRIFANLYEFRNYAGNKAGNYTHALWDEKAEEVVSYDATQENTQAVYASIARAMTRQYFFYRNGDWSVHPWFGEGIADYYGGARAKKGKVEIGPNDALMNKTEPESNRLARARALLREGKMLPLEKFLRLGAQEYRADWEQTTAQGWTLVYFLRSGGKSVPGWNKEWAKILPNYLQQVVESRDANRALEETLKGIDLAALENSWLEFAKTL